ncbi:MAG TPA: TetR/AcrR family transcriptional regulator [Saprospiraceae bacterium]|nr:TetR/AcrR family transcriptional regulator [Saprospiraceae bacterium]
MNKDEQIKHRILLAGASLFRKKGFRATSMDDLAFEIGMSKKTIYKYFSSKSKLIEELVMAHIAQERTKISAIIQSAQDPVQAMVEIGQLVYEHYKEMSEDVIVELKKYFYDIWKQVDRMQTEFMLKGITLNMKKGIELGLYRQELNPEFITNVYVSSIIASCDNEEHASGKELFYLMLLEYHMYGVVTPKGRKLFEKYKTKLGQ